jgi:serine/threonine protein kinase
LLPEANSALTKSIGAGGMGKVCRAKDTRLGRIAAIKVSAEQFSEDSDERLWGNV